MKKYRVNVNGTVYFRTRKFSEYGKLSHKNLDDLRSGRCCTCRYACRSCFCPCRR